MLEQSQNDGTHRSDRGCYSSIFTLCLEHDRVIERQPANLIMRQQPDMRCIKDRMYGCNRLRESSSLERLFVQNGGVHVCNKRSALHRMLIPRLITYFAPRLCGCAHAHDVGHNAASRLNYKPSGAMRFAYCTLRAFLEHRSALFPSIFCVGVLIEPIETRHFPPSRSCQMDT